ncbi:MAG: M16 family metallopeptidase [Planctomycetota bacterium]
MELKHTQLPNGLDVVAELNESAKSMAAGFFVRTGSRDETPEISGVSHFLEHMMFKGTDRRTALDVNREFDELGADYNAFTTEENTVYYGSVLPEYQERLLDLLGDILRPSLREEDFDTEKGVILDEIALYEDMPRFRVYDHLMSTFFDGHPLGNQILGTTKSISALRREQMLDYFRRRYSPGNLALVGVGKVDWGAFVDKAREMCDRWEPVEVDRATPPTPTEPRTRTLVDEKLSREHIGLMSPAPTAQEDDRFAAHVLADVFGDSTGSRLFYALVDTAVADEAQMSYSAMDRAGGWISFLSCDPPKTARAIRTVREEMDRFLRDGPDDAELSAAKNKIATTATLGGELPMGRLLAVGFDWIYRHDYTSLPEQIDRMYAVTREDVLRLGRQYDPAKMTILALGPAESLE